MLKVVRRLIIVAASSLSLSNAGLAADEAPKPLKSLSSVSVTPTIGAFVFAGATALNPAAAAGIKVTRETIGTSIEDSFGVEGTLNYFNTSTTRTPSQSADGYLLRLDAIYSIPLKTKKYVPFFAIGAGDMYVDKGSSTDNNFVLNYGAGVKYYLEDWLALRGDIRHMLVYGDTNVRNTFEFSTGLTYVFGKDHTKKAIPKAPEKMPEVPQAEPEQVPSEPVTPENIDKLGIGGPAVVGVPLAPPAYEPPPPPELPAPPVETPAAPPAQPEGAATAPAPEAAPAPAPAPAPESQPAQAPPVPESRPAPAPEPPAAPPQAPPAAEQPGPRVIYKVTVEFDFDKWVVRSKYWKELATLAQKIQEMPGTSVSIEGHTDNVGNVPYNDKLSQRRAKALRDYLVKFGVPASRITTRGYGFSKPAAENATAAGRQKNRRATAVAILIKTSHTPAPGNSAPATAQKSAAKPATKSSTRSTTNTNNR